MKEKNKETYEIEQFEEERVFVKLMSGPYEYTRQKIRPGSAIFYCTECLKLKPKRRVAATAIRIAHESD